MRILSFDCGMGAAGDMLSAALYELLPDQVKAEFLETMNALLPGVSVCVKPTRKCGILGTKFHVTIHGEEESAHEGHHQAGKEHAHAHEHEHHHGKSLHEICQVLKHLNIPDSVYEHAHAVYALLADAESTAHGEQVEQIHFHEIGELDAIADIVAVCLLIDLLKPDQIFCTPVHVGAGHFRCAHGVLPVPAPATALLLKGVPIYGGEIQGELCTPTGAALLKHFCSFARHPIFAPQEIGYGMGSKDFEYANCVRAVLGETAGDSETVVELCCNLDDMTPEAIGYAIERLWESAILDVFTASIGMKKNRPGTLLTCLCRKEDEDQIVRLLLQHTTTLGVRQHVCNRFTLARTVHEVTINNESLRVKRASGWGIQREKAEYEDVAHFARANDLSFAEASEIILRASQDQSSH